jgi:hypothetical protein
MEELESGEPMGFALEGAEHFIEKCPEHVRLAVALSKCGER